MDRKYYEAYDDRYRQIHALDLQWFHDNPSAIVKETIQEYGINSQHKLLELGCGEGRDAFPLLNAGYDLLATDISPEAIRFCVQRDPNFAHHFAVLDCVSGDIKARFDFIFAVAVVHMLVLDQDRNAFYSFVRSHLTHDGIALICTMGDGTFERQSDVTNAFDLQDRTHEQTGRSVQIASTSCRMVNFSTFEKELNRNGLVILKQGITTIEPDFSHVMYAVVKQDLSNHTVL